MKTSKYARVQVGSRMVRVSSLTAYAACFHGRPEAIEKLKQAARNQGVSERTIRKELGRLPRAPA